MEGIVGRRTLNVIRKESKLVLLALGYWVNIQVIPVQKHLTWETVTLIL